jgi:hypothetical protein
MGGGGGRQFSSEEKQNILEVDRSAKQCQIARTYEMDYLRSVLA